MESDNEKIAIEARKFIHHDMKFEVDRDNLEQFVLDALNAKDSIIGQLMIPLEAPLSYQEIQNKLEEALDCRDAFAKDHAELQLKYDELDRAIRVRMIERDQALEKVKQLELQLEQKCKSEIWYSEKVVELEGKLELRQKELEKFEDTLEIVHDKILHARDYLKNHAPKSAEYEIILEAIQKINQCLRDLK